jgi:anti-anti-sigma factor
MDYSSEASMHFQIEKDTLIFSGRIHRKNIAGLIPLLMKQLQEYPQLILDLEKVESIDTAFLQLLLSTKKTAEQERKRFHLKKIPHPLQKNFQLSGFSMIFES